ncbi:unnamed protein product [Symbiodinium natans]|uniref:Uncharacterized protein n=1 Tax=Symbiodinium natans TaxID=878477 RepID=A0A812MVS0_9DINO|nr:unnamed protein product [Symbiodinium natans]
METPHCCALLALLLAACVCIQVYRSNGEDLPIWLLYTSGVAATSVNSILHFGYESVDAAPMHQGYFSKEAVVEGHVRRGRRELNVGSFLAAEMWRLGRNATALELGCGNGQLTHSLNSISGLRCVGLDGYKAIQSLGENYRQWDLTTFFPMEGVDYTISFEVGEHIPPEAEAAFLRTLSQAKEGIILAWATPGQAGHGHVNGRWQRYLIGKLTTGHLRYCLALSHQLAQGFSQGFHSLWEYRNLMVFVAKDSAHICDLPTRDLVASVGVLLAAAGAAVALTLALRGPLQKLATEPGALGSSGLMASCIRMFRASRLGFSGKISTV